MSREKRRRWIVLMAAACALTACSTDDQSTDAQRATPESKQTHEERGADDIPQTAATRSSDGSLLVPAPGCKIYAQQTGGQIRWYTRGGSKGCEAWIVGAGPDGATQGSHVVDTNAAYHSDWYEAASGQQVCVNGSGGELVCEPDK